MNWDILIPLLVGLISAVLGYLIGKISGSGSSRNGNVDVYKSRVSKLEADLADCKANKTSVGRDDKERPSKIGNTAFGSRLKEIRVSDVESVSEPIVGFSADAVKAVFGKKIKQDDLKIVEGIGPKIEELFHNHNIKTWRELANCSVSKCQEVLNSGGDRYKIHKPDTWPKQSKMAYVGDWQGLKNWQDRLDGGK